MFKSEKKTPQCKKKTASLPPDWRGFNYCYDMCRRQPLRISRPVVTLAVSMTLFNINKNLETNSTTSNFRVPIQLRHCILHCLPSAIAEHLIITTTNRYNRKLRLAVFVFGWVNCRVFENLMGTHVKPLDCAGAHKTPSQPVTPFYSLSLSSWTQDTVHPC